MKASSRAGLGLLLLAILLTQIMPGEFYVVPAIAGVVGFMLLVWED